MTDAHKPHAAADRPPLVRRLLRLAGKAALAILALLVLLAITGAWYQHAGAKKDREELAPPGELVSIGSHRLHIRCSGTGSPTVLLDAGAGGWSLGWDAIQPAVAAHTRVCAYDRSGVGWSEAGPGALDGVAITRELHALLDAASVPRPIVYAGHSLGGNLAQIYYGQYPADLAGLVLVDPGRPVDMLEDFRGSREEAMAIDSCGWTCAAAAAATRLGLLRLAMNRYTSRHFDDESLARYRAGMSRPGAVATIAGYLAFVPKTAYQNLVVESFGDVPLRIVYSADTRKPEGDETEDDVRAWHRETLADMAELAARSSRGAGPVVVKGATHSSIVLQPEHAAQVSEQIVEVIDVVRADAAGRSGRHS